MSGRPPQANAKEGKKPAPETTSRSTTLVNRLKPKQTPEAAHAELVVAGLAINAVTALQFSKPFGDVDLTECLKALVDAAEHKAEYEVARSAMFHVGMSRIQWRPVLCALREPMARAA